MRSIYSLFKLEMSKFIYNPTYRVIIALFTIVSPIIIFLGKDVIKDPPPPIPSSRVFYEFPTVWDYQGYAGSWLVSFLLGFIAIYIVTSEVSYRTLRQNILTGLSRKEFFVSKLLHVVFLSFAATLLYVISTVVIGLIHTESADLELIFDNNFAIVRYFFMCLGYMTFGLFAGFLIRRGTLAIFTYFVYMNILELIFMAIHVYYFKNESRNYWPMNAVEDLMPLPLYRLSDYFIKKQWDFNIVLPYNVALMMTVLYISIAIILMYRNFSKRDI